MLQLKYKTCTTMTQCSVSVQN